MKYILFFLALAVINAQDKKIFDGDFKDYDTKF